MGGTSGAGDNHLQSLVARPFGERKQSLRRAVR
jgi:hypothetical protein